MGLFLQTTAAPGSALKIRSRCFRFAMIDIT